MPQPITFYFEYASPYSYLATRTVDAVAERCGRDVRWRPIRLRDVLAKAGIVADTPEAKIDYVRRDAQRCAELAGWPFVMPERFPPDATRARLTFYHLDARDRDLARRFAHGVATRYYGCGLDISTADDLAAIAEPLGMDGVGLDAAADDPEAAHRLESNNAAAARLGCFGVPWLEVDGECFFGHDRLPYIERWSALRFGRTRGGEHE